jgi:hypothetical protein
MDDLLRQTARRFPSYLRDLLELLTGPRELVAKQLATTGYLERATIFLAIGVAINFLLKLPLSSDAISWEILTTGAFSLVLWTLTGVVIWASCRTMGGWAARPHADRGFLLFRCARVRNLAERARVRGHANDKSGCVCDRDCRLARWDYLAVIGTPVMLQRQGVGLATGTTVVGTVVALLWIIVIWGAFSDAHKLADARAGKNALRIPLRCRPSTAHGFTRLSLSGPLPTYRKAVCGDLLRS